MFCKCEHFTFIDDLWWGGQTYAQDELRMVFTLLEDWLEKKKKRLGHRDYMDIKAKIFTIWAFTENVCQPLVCDVSALG